MRIIWTISLVVSFVLLSAVSWKTTQKDDISPAARKFVAKSLENSTITFKRIEQSRLDSSAIGSLFYELIDSDTLIGYFVYNQAAACRPGGCASFDPKTNKDAYDPFYIGVIYDAHGMIHRVKILDYYSEYGMQITRKKWLRQFEKKSGCDYQEDVVLDGVTGATISAQSFLYKIKGNCNILERYANKQVE